MPVDNQTDGVVSRNGNEISIEKSNVDFKTIQETVFEEILTDSKFNDGFLASDLCESPEVVQTVLQKLKTDGWLVKDETEDIWYFNPEHQLSGNKTYCGRVTPDNRYCATPKSIVRNETLKKYRANPNEPEPNEENSSEGYRHLWAKFALEFANPHFGYFTDEPYDAWRTPDFLFCYHRKKKELVGEAVLAFCSYSSDNGALKQVLDYLRRGYGVRILISEDEPSVRNMVRDALSAVIEPDFSYGSFNASKGWFTLGQLITLNEVNYKIRGSPENTSNQDGLPVNFSEEMCPSELEGTFWELDWDVHPAGYGHVGTFHFQEASVPYLRCDDSVADGCTHLVEIYANNEGSQYIIEQVPEHAPKPHILSRTELKEWIQQAKVTRSGPATGSGLYR
jgi:hypothetical protein